MFSVYIPLSAAFTSDPYHTPAFWLGRGDVDTETLILAFQLPFLYAGQNAFNAHFPVFYKGHRKGSQLWLALKNASVTIPDGVYLI